MKTTLLFAAMFSAAATFGVTEKFDVVIYGSSPAALTAAIQAQKLGKSAVIVSPEMRIGGLTTGGLGQTDIGNKSAFGALALQFYRDIATYYKNPKHWKYEKRTDYLPDGQCAFTVDGSDSMWTFEPHAALAVLEQWEKKFKLNIRRGKRLDRTPVFPAPEAPVVGCTVDGSKITVIRTEDGDEFVGEMYIDATYEGDLMAAAKVTYRVGREDNSLYGETISGRQRSAAKSHQFAPGVSPYVKADDPSSGLLPFVEPDDEAPDGDGDQRVQAYCFRMCLTDVPENRIPFAKPADYDERNYELLFRNYEALERCGYTVTNSVWCNGKELKNPLPAIMSRMPNRKTDTNNRTGFSTDFIGQNYDWPEADYEQREELLKRHLSYQQGLMWTLANHPRIPARVREYFSRWGTCKDEFQDGLGDGWQRQLYVREARRLVGETVITQADCLGKRVADRPIAMAAYGMDSHHCRRYVTKEGWVRNEGDIQDWSAGGKPYPIDYGAIVPKRTDLRNLLVPVCVSASHMAFGSIRMEPVFFALGQSAGAAAALAIDQGCQIQDVNYAALRKVLLAEGQVIQAVPTTSVK